MVQGWIQIVVFVAVVIALTPVLGGYMARVYEGGKPVLLERVLGPFERLLYRVLRVNPSEGQDWKRYARSLLVFSAVSWIASINSTPNGSMTQNQISLP